jgi:hypothetical protein
MYYEGAARLDERNIAKLDFGFCGGISLLMREQAAANRTERLQRPD